MLAMKRKDRAYSQWEEIHLVDSLIYLKEAHQKECRIWKKKKGQAVKESGLLGQIARNLSDAAKTWPYRSCYWPREGN
ncbi:hypothetical protein GCM10020331_063690 [Ectobacillus funiculus]